jgi:hypothetical protein
MLRQTVLAAAAVVGLMQAATAQPRIDCNEFANEMVANGQRGQQARCAGYGNFNMDWNAQYNWCQGKHQQRLETELGRWRSTLDGCLAQQAAERRPVPPPPMSRGSVRWIPGRGQSCDAACNGAGLRAVNSGNYFTNGRDTGNAFYVCAGEAEGRRPGYNLRPNWADTCMVPQAGSEVRTDRYACLCE